MKLTKNEEMQTSTLVRQKKKKIIKMIIIICIIFAVTATIGIFVFLKIMERETKPIINENMNFEVKTVEFQNRNVFIISKKENKNSNKVILYFHGGAYIEEMTEKYWYFLERVVEDTGATIIIPDYPLAPMYSYEDVFNMITPLYKEIISKVDINNLILIGDSAGGGMTLALIEKLNEEEIAVPNKTILISPWLDVTMENSDIDEVQKKDKMLNKEMLKLAGIAYAKSIDNTKNYLISPIYGDLSKIKNLTILTGTDDILNPDVKVLKKKADENSIDIDVKEYEGAKHIWFIVKNSDKEITDKGYNDFIQEIKE